MDDDLCPVCAGSGEGVSDRSQCPACKGWGVQRPQGDGPDEPREASPEVYDEDWIPSW